MRYVAIGKVEPGMMIAQALYDTFGRTLVGIGCELTENLIAKIEEYGFDGLYIEDELSEGIYVEDVISPELRRKGLKCVKECDIDGCKKVGEEIVKEMLERGVFTLDLIDLRAYDEYTFAHSVNVAVISSIIGIGYNMEEEKLKNLVISALLHDLGKVQIPPGILNKPGRLTQEEFQVMKTHAELSYQFIKERWDLSSYVKEAVLHHHENVDGTGYPHGIDGSEQTIYTKILHVADVYDALISKRPYKNPYSPAEAAEYLMGGCSIMFDKNVVEKLLAYVPLFPKGTEVTISDGRSGIVYENSGKHNLRPIIKLEDGTLLDMSEKESYNLVLKYSGEEVDDFQTEKLERERSQMLIPIEKKTIMIVDDMVTNLQMMRAILEGKYELKLMKSGKQALKYMEKNEYPDMIIMDVDMPEMNGIETTEKINQMTNSMVPVLFVTALSDKQTVMACKRLEAAGYIVRPYKPTYIKSEVERILTGRSEIY